MDLRRCLHRPFGGERGRCKYRACQECRADAADGSAAHNARKYGNDSGHVIYIGSGLGND
jgi:hypothetical protein